MRSVTGAAAALVLLAACAGPVAPSGPDPDVARGDDDAAPAACVAPAVPLVPVGTDVDLGGGRGPDPVGLAAGVGTVAVLDLGAGDAVALAAGLADVIDPCGTADPVPAAGPLGALVVAAAIASAEARPLAPPARPDVVADPAAGATAVAAATRDLMERWATGEVLVVAEEDVAAWVAIVAEASTAAVPLVLPTLPVPAEARAEAEGSSPEAGAGEAVPDVGSDAGPDAGSDAGPGPGSDAGPEPDPAVVALAALPDGAVLTVVASDPERAAVLADRVAAADRIAASVRVVATDAGAPPVGWSGTAGGTLWMLDPSDPVRLLVAAAAAGARDEALVVADPADATQVLRRAAALRRADPARLLIVGGGAAGTTTDTAATTAWALDVALHADPLPWGGWLPLDGTRIVALYGAPGAPSLGALGQQDLDGTIVRVRETAARYDDLDGLRVVPGFDLIVTVASASAGPAGDYSQRVPIERLRPLIDRARAEGMAVFIDLQPGQTDFLAQAQEYEELLLEPHVFLALDPEWRLRPGQVHLRQIGSVEAAEVQRVADWLAGLVRRERLPQKAFMLHQFLLEMLPDRDTVVVPPELVGVVHVDGQGPVATKQRTFRIMAEDADPQWRWGWKQFLRIDTPAVMDPADVIDRSPSPVVITYQ